MGQYFGRLESVCPLVGMWHSARQTQSFQVSKCRTCDLASRLSEAGQAVQLHPEITVVTCLTNRSQKLAIIVYVGHMLLRSRQLQNQHLGGVPVEERSGLELVLLYKLGLRAHRLAI